MSPTLIGSFLTLSTLCVFGVVFIKRNTPILAFYFALCLVGIGYLITTGAMEDIGTWALVFASHPVKE